MKMGQLFFFYLAHVPFICMQKKDFDVLMGHLEKRLAQETLISIRVTNEHQIGIAYGWGPAKNEIRIRLYRPGPEVIKLFYAQLS